MAEVVVVGAGLGGLAVAARLAKLGHRVTVCERTAVAGGAIRTIEADGFRWDAGPSSTTLPAVLRDLFRKSGRPIERYLDLTMRPVARRHVFPDDTSVDLPTGSRARQTEAVESSLGRGTGASWTAYVDAQADTWDRLRQHVLEPADGAAALADKTLARRLRAKTSLATLHRKAFKDARLRLMAELPFVLAGSQPRDVPSFAAVEAYVERTFGVWTVAGGLGQLTRALLVRLDERGVGVRVDTEVTALSTGNGRVTGVQTAAGDHLAADVVVTDIDPRRVFGGLLSRDPELPSLPGRQVFESATPAIPVGVTHLGLEGELPRLPGSPGQPGQPGPTGPPGLPEEVVLYGEPLLVVNTQGLAPRGKHAWTVLRRGSAREDVLSTLARRGIDLRKNVVTRLDRTPVDLFNETNGSSYGLAWAGWRAHVQRAAQTHPLPGLYLLGASMHPGASIPYVGWGAAHVAARIGKASVRGGP